MDINGKTILLTGAAGGIGSAIARQLAEQGAHLILTGRNQQQLNALAAQLPGGGHQCITADLCSAQDREHLANRAIASGVDILINNAGASQLALLDDISDDHVAELLKLNLEVPILLSKALLPHLRQREQAVIVNVGSIFGAIGYPGSSVYSAAKFGLRGFTESLRRELGDSHLRIIYFAPRATATTFNSDQMHSMNRELGNTVDEPEKVAAQLLTTLLKGKSASRHLGWPEGFFVRLNGLIPKLVDNALIKQLPIIRRHARSATAGVAPSVQATR